MRSYPVDILEFKNFISLIISSILKNLMSGESWKRHSRKFTTSLSIVLEKDWKT